MPSSRRVYSYPWWYSRCCFIQLQNEIEADYDVGVVSNNMIVALFLASNGADIHIKDLQGKSPLGLCAKDSTALLKQYSEIRCLNPNYAIVIILTVLSAATPSVAV